MVIWSKCCGLETRTLLFSSSLNDLSLCVLNSSTAAVWGASGNPLAMPSSEPPKWPPQALTRNWSPLSGSLSQTSAPMPRSSSISLASSRWPVSNKRKMRPANSGVNAQRKVSQINRWHWWPMIDAPMCGLCACGLASYQRTMALAVVC